MDSDLKEVLEVIREENAAAHAETRRRIENLQMRFEAAQAETLRRFEAADAKNAETHATARRHFETLAEYQQHKLDLVVERVVSTGEKVDRLDAKVDRLFSDHESRITRLEISASLHGQL
jgi:N12 class adenine-specific DNA methylase